MERALLVLLLMFVVDLATSRGDIYRWDTGEVIPGTEGIESGPDLPLENRVLAYADMWGWNLLRSRLNSSDLTNARLQTATLTDADLTGAVVAGASFGYSNLMKDQLYSTASYEAKNLTGIGLEGNDLSHWSFSGQDLTNANFKWATISNIDLTGADVTGADFGSATNYGLTKEQLYSTASYLSKDLRGVHLGHGDTFGFPGPTNDLSGWDFSGQDLTHASFNGANLANTDLAGAVVNGVNFEAATHNGFTEDQFQSTASYRSKNLRGIDMRSNNLTDWDFSGQDLTNTFFSEAKLTNADFTGADARRAATRYIRGGFATRIFFDGSMAGFELAAGERMLIRDDDGMPGPLQQSWAAPRSPIPVTIHDKLTMVEGSVLQLLFESDPWDSLISFQVGIPVQLGGALDLTFADEVDIAEQLGRTLQVFDWTGVTPSGQFVVSSPYIWDATNLYATGEVTLYAVPEPTSELIMLVGVMTIATCCRLRQTVVGSADSN